MPHDLSGKTIAAIISEGFEQVELTEPKKALEQVGARVEIVAPSAEAIRAWNRTDWGDVFEVDVRAGDVTAGDYVALLLPGGKIGCNQLREHKQTVALAHEFLVHRKPVAAICHGPWILMAAGGVAGRRLTSHPDLKDELETAEARWQDEPTVVQANVLTSRTPDDLPAFNERFIELIADYAHDPNASREYRMAWDPGV